MTSSAGWHQARVARELGITTGTVSRYWSGETIPSVPVLRLLANIVGEPYEEAGGAYRPTAMRDGPRWLEDWETSILTDLRRLTPAARRRVIAALREILDAMSQRVSYTASPGRRQAGGDAVVDAVVADELRQATDHALQPSPQRDKRRRRAPVEKRSQAAGDG